MAVRREEGALLASVASVSALLEAFPARPDFCLHLTAATHLKALYWVVLLPGTPGGIRQWLVSRNPTWEALEQLCFETCPQAVLAALGPADAQRSRLLAPFILLAHHSLPSQALLLCNALSCGRCCQAAQPTVLPGLLEELEWVQGWVQALNALACSEALIGERCAAVRSPAPPFDAKSAWLHGSHQHTSHTKGAAQKCATHVRCMICRAQRRDARGPRTHMLQGTC